MTYLRGIDKEEERKNTLHLLIRSANGHSGCSVQAWVHWTVSLTPTSQAPTLLFVSWGLQRKK